MSEIKLLDKSVYNRIAAGEVVERPLSIVKELVENSIDAGATSVSIDIENGGTTKISVSDNGKGISPDDVPTAFLPHATSKISGCEDLDNIRTLGFRGEALPSIAAVSRVKMTTRTAGSNMGFVYTVDNGEVIDSGMCGCPYGTSVVVTNLFEKIPARKKFLKKISVEESAITATVSKLILANYKVSFRYSVNGKLVYQSAGESMENAVYAVYGKEFFDSLLPVENQMFDIRLSGFACKPSAAKHTKAFQTLIVNGRYVQNEEVSYWIYGCYMNYLMKRQYPAYVLYLTMPYDLVDVNVHPNKLEIKFANESVVKKIITDTIKTQIVDSLMRPQDYFSSDSVDEKVGLKNIPEKNYSADISGAMPQQKADNGNHFDSTVLGNIESRTVISHQNRLGDLREPVSEYTFELLKSTVADMTADTVYGESKEKIIPPKHNSSGETKSFFEKITEELGDMTVTPIGDNKNVQQQMFADMQARYCGKLFNTYLIYECGTDAFLIDQHAAHERILFDKLTQKYDGGKVVPQPLLVPYTFSLGTDDGALLSDCLAETDASGFHFEQYDNNTFSLKSVPAECAGMDVTEFVSAMIDGLHARGKVSRSEIMRNNLAQWACKAAVKGGMDIDRSEIDALVNQTLNHDRVLVCPHGRPIVLRLKKSDIEKMFKRIV